MRVRDIVTKDVITISNSKTIVEADGILSTRKINRLLVIDDGKLVGIVSKSTILKATAPRNIPVVVRRLPHLFFGMNVREIMVINEVIVTPDMSVEEAVFVA